tara:strand:- start:194 stop:439 length:246 start_codon:yes stop_codon:yes gene_type:complete
MAWEILDVNDSGLFAHLLSATDLIVYTGDSDYTVCDGSVVLGNFTDMREAMAFAEDYDTRWCEKNISTEWVKPNIGRTREW